MNLDVSGTLFGMSMAKMFLQNKNIQIIER